LVLQGRQNMKKIYVYFGPFQNKVLFQKYIFILSSLKFFSLPILLSVLSEQIVRTFFFKFLPSEDLSKFYFFLNFCPLKIFQNSSALNK
jgi:hypothetical protein